MLDAFGASHVPVPVTGGQGSTWRAGHLALKPVDDEEETLWRCALLDTVVEHGFRVSRPVRARDGSWIVDGWTASRWVDGRPGPSGHWAELLAAADAFMAALRPVPRPDFLERRSHWWAVADRAAWSEHDLLVLPALAPVAERLSALTAPADAPSQLVHGDLAGNVLFEPREAPAVIDLSPYWRPAAYALGIAVADGVLAHGEDAELVTLAAGRTSIPSVARGALFRLLTLQQGLVDRGRAPDPADVAPYQALADILEQRR